MGVKNSSSCLRHTRRSCLRRHLTGQGPTRNDVAILSNLSQNITVKCSTTSPGQCLEVQELHWRALRLVWHFWHQHALGTRSLFVVSQSCASDDPSPRRRLSADVVWSERALACTSRDGLFWTPDDVTRWQRSRFFPRMTALNKKGRQCLHGVVCSLDNHISNLVSAQIDQNIFRSQKASIWPHYFSPLGVTFFPYRDWAWLARANLSQRGHYGAWPTTRLCETTAIKCFF